MNAHLPNEFLLFLHVFLNFREFSFLECDDVLGEFLNFFQPSFTLSERKKKIELKIDGWHNV